MANITKRHGKDGSLSYLIRVFLDENGEGRQHTKSKTWRPAPGMKEATADKQAEKQAVLFENQVKRGLLAYDSRTTLGEYAKHWIENEPLAPKTRARYWELYKRINAALGHIKLEKLQARHLEAFYKNLAESGVNKRAAYAQSEKLGPLLKKRGLSRDALGKLAGVAASTVSMAARGERVSQKTAAKIAGALEIPVGELFTLHDSEKPLSDKTIQHHHRLLSAILEKAKRERLVPFNVAREHATAPKVQRKEAVYLDDEEAAAFCPRCWRKGTYGRKPLSWCCCLLGCAAGSCAACPGRTLTRDGRSSTWCGLPSTSRERAWWRCPLKTFPASGR